MTNSVKLNIGCGSDIRDGYINIDPFAEEADMCMHADALNFDDGTADEILSVHMLEHLSKCEVADTLAEWRRVLKDTGTLKIIVPDFPWCIEQWLRLPEKARWSWAIATIYGLQDHPGEFHKTGFSADRLRAVLEDAGFGNVEVSTCFSHGMQS